MSKNRDVCRVPIEAARVALTAKPGVEGSDYINASWVQVCYPHHGILILTPTYSSFYTCCSYVQLLRGWFLKPVLGHVLVYYRLAHAVPMT